MKLEGRTHIVLLLLLREHAPDRNQKIESSVVDVHVLERATEISARMLHESGA